MGSGAGVYKLLVYVVESSKGCALPFAQGIVGCGYLAFDLVQGGFEAFEFFSFNVICVLSFDFHEVCVCVELQFFDSLDVFSVHILLEWTLDW